MYVTCLHVTLYSAYVLLTGDVRLSFQVDEALMIKNTDIAKELSLPPVKLHCSSKFSMNFPDDEAFFFFSPPKLLCTSTIKPLFAAATVLAEDAIKAALADYRLKQHDDQQEAVRASS